MMKQLALLLYVVVGIVHLAGTLIPHPDVMAYSKVLLMPLLLFYLYSYLEGNVNKTHLQLAGAIVLCWIGDILLIWGEEAAFFMGGVGVFLLGHLFYTIVLARSSWQWPEFRLLPLLPILTYGMFFSALVVPNAFGFEIPVVIYVLFIMGMTSVARLRFGYTTERSFQIAFIGSVLFVISDSILAYNKFMRALPYVSFWIMATYISAQFMICYGVLQHPDKK